MAGCDHKNPDQNKKCRVGERKRRKVEREKERR